MDQAAVEPEVSSEELRERMIRKRKAIDLMELSFAEDAARFANTDEYDELGFVSPIDWIRFNCHMTSGAAADRVAVGKTMNRLPRSVEAVSQGEIGLAHVTVMARTAEALKDRFDERPLIEFARANSPGKFPLLLPSRTACRGPRRICSRRGRPGPRAATVTQHVDRRFDGVERRPRRFRRRGAASGARAAGPKVRRPRRARTRAAAWRRAGRAGVRRNAASEPPSHDLRRDAARPGRRRGGGHGVFAADLVQNRRAFGLR